ncbi:ICP22 family protein [Actinophytocola algeriensis]|uniref:Uncharacterized protein n=1 Tax=Actinophytocola algeriensis TaxID=1768010 RepID=A0A7W7Q5D1_9PSEU|nr:hypothetical protein [Actinophytocola algeriensis]MBB4907192.1 hypothetical protein [Actinophytocola algeriensis]MBE1478675.1 hypothetical protein [Actinophytocola algeriensis]
MRGGSQLATAAGLAALVLGLVAAPAAAQPTTPIPTPTDPESPGMSSPVGPVPPGRAVGDAGTGLGIVRILPNSTPTKAIVPGMEDKLPKQSAAELGFGLATAQVNSEAYLSFERSVAQAAPGGLAIQGGSPQAPGALSQTASPDNPQPIHNGLTLPSTPLDTLIRAGALQGQVHARWSDTVGPCVGTIADATTEIASLSLLNAIPTLPSTPDLTGVFDAPKLDANADKAVIDGLKKLAGPLSTLGGALSGGAKPSADGAGSLVSLPNTLSARSVVRLVDIPGSANKAVQSTSTMQVAALKLLAGTPFEITIRVVSQPTLQVTSTGDEKTSTVTYTAPVLAVEQGGKVIGQLDAANPKFDIPVGIPLAPGAPSLPIIGDLLANGQQVTQALQRLDLGVIRLGVAQLDQRGTPMTSPFTGFQLGATARMLDVQVLPTQALGLPNLPSALAQVALGEQVARAYAPTGGVVCRTSEQPTPPPTPKPQGRAPMELAYTTMAYKTIPMFWAGTAMLLIGVVLVAALPTLRSPRLAQGGPGATDPDAGSAEQVRDTGTGATGRESADSAEAGDAESTDAEAAETGEAESAKAEPAEAEAEPGDAEPTEAEPAEAESGHAEPTEAEPVEAERADVESADVATADAESADAEAGNAESAESVHTESVQAESAEAEVKDQSPDGETGK